MNLFLCFGLLSTAGIVSPVSDKQKNHLEDSVLSASPACTTHSWILQERPLPGDTRRVPYSFLLSLEIEQIPARNKSRQSLPLSPFLCQSIHPCTVPMYLSLSISLVTGTKGTRGACRSKAGMEHTLPLPSYILHSLLCSHTHTHRQRTFCSRTPRKLHTLTCPGFELC